eukprot:TRINITY_DN22649_c0_g1_i1.p1 TRINITY_DN22649_c0_g1~~TRINITY_DN22649_c0_g1_i1.p1  ORF type:complete len:336 (-),score=45.28 TRINITY_DN22649_c0_g1_i1:33-1040(-)
MNPTPEEEIEAPKSEEQLLREQAEAFEYFYGETQARSTPIENPEACEICQTNPFKYKCPNCKMKSCSMPCEQQHRTLKNCDGRRHAEKFIPVREFDDSNFRRDIGMLSDMIERTENAKKWLSSLRFSKDELRSRLLRTESKNLHNITLKVAPQVFSRHINNLSFYHTRSKTFFWTIELLFTVDCFNDPAKNAIGVLTKPISDGLTLMEALRDETVYDKVDQLSTSERLMLRDEIAKSIDNGTLVILFHNNFRVEFPAAKVANTLFDVASTAAENTHVNVALPNTIRDVLTGSILYEYPTFLIYTKPSLVPSKIKYHNPGAPVSYTHLTLPTIYSV